jgi:hypothetical protein
MGRRGCRKLLVGDGIRVGGMFMMKLRIPDKGEEQGSQTSGVYIYNQSKLQLNI